MYVYICIHHTCIYKFILVWFICVPVSYIKTIFLWNIKYIQTESGLQGMQWYPLRTE